MNKAALALILMAGLAACDSKTAQPPLAAPQPAPAAQPAKPAAGPATPTSAQPAPGPAMPPGHAAAAPDAGGPTVSELGVAVTLPAGWKRNPPANQMRLAEAEVPDASGDPTKVCLVVFSTAGGSVDDNITRWSGQVRDGAGQPVPPKKTARTVGGLSVTVVEMTGNFAGMGDPAPRPDWTLRGAIIEAPQGLLFIKMTGPAAQMSAAATAFDALVDSAKKN